MLPRIYESRGAALYALVRHYPFGAKYSVYTVKLTRESNGDYETET
jgi:hypothetical protein